MRLRLRWRRREPDVPSYQAIMEARATSRQEELALVNPLCSGCRFFERHLIRDPPYIMVRCRRLGNPKGEGAECVRYVPRGAGCENCVSSFLYGTMIGGRQVLGCTMGREAFVGNICDCYRRRSGEDGEEEDRMRE